MAVITTQSTGRQFITFEKVRPDTPFTAFEHVWCTQNNGGPQAHLEANCRFSGGTSSLVCGDWLLLGVAWPFASGSTPDSASRKPGDLTSDYYGTDRTGGLIVAAERTPADAGTLWAATNKGRLFVARNADGPAAAVEFVRIDLPATPKPLRDANRRRSRQPERGLRLLLRLQRADAAENRSSTPIPSPRFLPTFHKFVDWRRPQD